MIATSNVVCDYVSFHVCVTHNCDEHVEKMNDHHEGTHDEEKDQEGCRLLIS